MEECADIQYELFGPLAGVQIPKHERIHYHGTIEHEKLLENIKDADCLIMPFLINEIIEAVDPVKLYEYINFNKNILTCRYEEIERFEPFVYFYTGYDEFIKQILNLKKSNDVKYSNDDRETFLRENSWKCRVDTIIKTLKRKICGSFDVCCCIFSVCVTDKVANFRNDSLCYINVFSRKTLFVKKIDCPVIITCNFCDCS